MRKLWKLSMALSWLFMLIILARKTYLVVFAGMVPNIKFDYIMFFLFLSPLFFRFLIEELIEGLEDK